MTDFCSARASTVSVNARNVSSASASTRGVESPVDASSETLFCITAASTCTKCHTVANNAKHINTKLPQFSRLLRQLDQETKWAYSTMLPSPHGAAQTHLKSNITCIELHRRSQNFLEICPHLFPQKDQMTESNNFNAAETTLCPKNRTRILWPITFTNIDQYQCHLIECSCNIA